MRRISPVFYAALIATSLATGCGPSGNTSAADAKSPTEPPATAAQAAAEQIYGPEDLIALHRAILAAPPGSTLRLGPGEFEGFRLGNRVILEGAGADQTVFVFGEGAYIDTVEFPSLSTKAAGFRSVGFRYRDGVTPGSSRPTPVIRMTGDVILEDVQVGPGAPGGVVLSNGRFQLKDVRIFDHGIELNGAHPESVIDGLKVEHENLDRFDLVINNYSGGTFRNLDLAGLGAGAIVVSGAMTAPQFEGLDAFTLNDILYEDGATREGAVVSEIEPARLEAAAEQLRNAQRMGAPEGALTNQDGPKRRSLAAEYLKALQAAQSPEAAGKALVTYLQGVSETRDGSYYQTYNTQVASREWADFISTHGVDAAAAIYSALPEIGIQSKDEFYIMSLGQELGPQVYVAIQEREVRAALAQLEQTFPNFPEALATEQPEGVAQAFREGLQAARAIQREYRYNTRFPEPYTAYIQKQIDQVLATENAEIIVPVLALLPETASQGVPGRRSVLEGLSRELRRDIVILQRGLSE